MRSLSWTRLNVDEIWGLVGKKQNNTGLENDPSLGDVRTVADNYPITSPPLAARAAIIQGFRDDAQAEA
jgi:hypothetical protein